MSSKSDLTDKQALFVEYYLQDWNATDATRKAGYKGSYETLRSIGSQNLTKPKIKKYIEKRLEEVAITSNEVLVRLSQQATISLSDFIKSAGNLFVIDMDKVRERGHLVKKIKYTNHGVEIELHDAQAALVHLGKHHNLFKEKIEVEHTGEGGGPIQVQVQNVVIRAPDDK